jgi:hypothetical protein
MWSLWKCFKFIVSVRKLKCNEVLWRRSIICRCLKNPREEWMSQPHFEGSVRLPLTLPKMGLESPPGLSKIQSSIAGVKTPHLEVFFIPLERSWSLDVQNGLACVIWTSAAQIMVERKAGSQIGSLTLDH